MRKDEGGNPCVLFLLNGEEGKKKKSNKQVEYSRKDGYILDWLITGF